MFSMQICHLVIGDDHLNLLMLREKGKTRDPNLKDTLLSHEMSGEDNIPDLTPSPGLSSILTNCIRKCYATEYLKVLFLTNWLKGVMGG